MSISQNNQTNKKLSYKLDKYVTSNPSNLFNNLKSLNPPTVNDRKQTKVIDKQLKEREDGFSIYLMGANEERIKNMRKKEQIEKNKIRSNNNSRSTATRKKWDGYQGKEKSSFERIDSKYEGKSNENRSKSRHNDKGTAFDYKIMSKLILDNNKAKISTTLVNPASKNLVSKESITNIQDMILDINKMNINLNTKLGIVESPVANTQVTSNNKRCRNPWGQPKYNFGINCPEHSASVEPSNEHSRGTKLKIETSENIPQGISNKKNSIASIGSVNNINNVEEFENFEDLGIEDINNINQLDTLGSNIKDENDLNLSNNNSMNSNNMRNILKNSAGSFKFSKDVLSPQRSLNRDKERDRDKSLKSGSIHYNYWANDREGINNSTDVINKKDIYLIENINNSDLLNLSNNLEDNQLGNLKSQVTLINLQNSKNNKKISESDLNNMKTNYNGKASKNAVSLSPNKKLKSAHSKNNTKSINQSKLVTAERPYSSIMNLSRLKNLNNNSIGNNTGGDLIKNAGKSILSDNIFTATKFNMQQIQNFHQLQHITNNNIPNIQFIYKSPQNKGKPQRPLSHLQKAKTNAPSTAIKTTTTVSNINSIQNLNKIVAERFSSRDHLPSFGNDVDLSANIHNFSGHVNNKKKSVTNYPLISNIQQVKSGLPGTYIKGDSSMMSGVGAFNQVNQNNLGFLSSNISPNMGSQNNTSTHFKKKFDILSKIDQLDENKLSKLAKVVEELANNDNQEDENSQNFKNTANNNSTKEVHNTFFNNFKDKFNINYIKADSVNFGNININLNKNKNDPSKSSKGDRKSTQIYDEELNNLIYDESSPSFKVKNSDQISKKNSFAGSMALNHFKTKRTMNASPISNFSVISIVILSTWGNSEKLGITEIQIFDNKNKKIEIIECHIFNGQEDSINKLYNNKFHTIDENDMWITNCNFSTHSNIKLEIYFEAELEVDSLVIWNFNGRDLTKGIKDIEIYRKNIFSWRGVVNKGSYNIKSDYSTKAILEKISISPSTEKFNFELTNLMGDTQEFDFQRSSPSKRKNVNINLSNLNNMNNLNSFNSLNTLNTLNNANNLDIKKVKDSKLLREELISQEEENSINVCKSNPGNKKESGSMSLVSNLNSARNTINNSLVQNENIYEKNVLRTSIGKKDGTCNFQNILNSSSHTNILASNNFSTNNISCSKIKLIFTSNYGDPSYIGITGIQFLDDKEEIINIDNAESIGAMPKDINTVFNNCGDPRIFENIFNNLNETTDDYYMWLTPFNSFTPPYLEIVFSEQINLSAIKFWNYNKPGQIQRGARIVDLILDENFITQKTIILRPGLAEESMDYSHTFLFPIVSFNFTDEELEPFRKIKPASLSYSQDYETPYLPTGFIISVKLITNWGDPNLIGLDGLEFFDQLGNSVFKNTNPRVISRNSLQIDSSKNDTANNEENLLNNLNNTSPYKLISKTPWITSYINTNLANYEEDAIVSTNNLDNTFSNFNSNKNAKINPDTNEDSSGKKSNIIYFIFDRPVSLSYIHFWNYSKYPKMGMKEIHISCDDNIIYKGCLKKAKFIENSKDMTTILFTSDSNITKNIDENDLPDFYMKNKYIINENLTSEENSSYMMQIDTEEPTYSSPFNESY